MTSKFKMSLDLNVLNHLGLNLYSNVPAVLSEIVANSYDADATVVNIEWNRNQNEIVITDNGHGMSVDEINSKYLTVGYPRRQKGEVISEKFHRKVMGRKGIGKLSVFSIAKDIELHSVKNGAGAALCMNIDDIKSTIGEKQSVYAPKTIEIDCTLISGTKLVLRNLKKNMTAMQRNSLKTRIARRFTVISDDNNFSVMLNGEPISVDDRGYYNKIQHCFLYNDLNGNSIQNHLPDSATSELRSNKVESYTISGWLGTAEKSNALNTTDGNINKVVIIIRGKVAQEDILATYNIGSFYTKYVFGEIHADFLDEDDCEDIATSSRQHINEDDERYQLLHEFIKKELDALKKSWEKLRSEQGTKKALEYESIALWFQSLDSLQQSKAKKLFGQINQIQNSSDDRKTLLKHAIIAFETLKNKNQLEKIENITTENIEQMIDIFNDFNAVEATLYHQIVRGRISIIKELKDKVSDNELEKVLQKFIYEHLWLLDPSWERATEKTPIMEQSVKTAFENLSASLTETEAKGRIDIRYSTTAGKHVIIELKRASVRTDTDSLIAQMKKYKSALTKVLQTSGEKNPHIECIFLIGTELSDWTQANGKEQSERQFDAVNMRVVFYNELLENSYKAYKEYLQADKKINDLLQILTNLEIELESSYK